MNGELFKIFERAGPERIALVLAVATSTSGTISTVPLAILVGILKAWKKVSGRNTPLLDLRIGGTPVRDRIMGVSPGSKNAYATPLNVASILRATMSFREGPEQQRKAISTMRVRER